MKGHQQFAALAKTIAPLARQLTALQQQMHAHGLFTNDRELLECENCGLKEDITFDGRLITDRESALGHDTGLRFEPSGKTRFRCPACGKLVAPRDCTCGLVAHGAASGNAAQDAPVPNQRSRGGGKARKRRSPGA